MPLTGYLKIPDIAGESQRADHEEEIDLYNIEWLVKQASAAEIGAGRTRGHAEIGPVIVHKYYDASSPYLALACMQGKSFDESVVMVRKDSGEAHLDYLTITLTNMTISHYQMLGASDEIEDGQMIRESLGLTCENIAVKYVVQDDAHAAGDEHEVEYDIAAGV